MFRKSGSYAITKLPDYQGLYTPCASYPTHDGDAMLAQKQIQLGSMFLNMAHVVEAQLEEAHLALAKLTESVGFFIGERIDNGVTFAATILQIAL